MAGKSKPLNFDVLGKAMSAQVKPETERGGEGEFDRSFSKKEADSKMKRTSIYIDDELWKLVQDAAKKEYGSTGAFIRRAIKERAEKVLEKIVGTM